MLRATTLLCFLAVACSAFTAEPEQLSADTSAVPVSVNDKRLHDSILKSAEGYIALGKTTKMATLIEQLKQKTCSLKLAKPAKKERSISQIYSQNKSSVVVMAGIYKCDKCNNWHSACATGWIISESGAAVTNYHVVNAPGRETLVAATADGVVMPVQSVLAASEEDDVAIVQLGGDHLTPLALVPDAPVGSKICAISHPDAQFFTLTDGIISRYRTHTVKNTEVQQMAITAEFARGSSGGPIFDESGNVAGMVASTIGIYYTVENGKKDNLQMVLKHCVPAASILKMIELGEVVPSHR